MPNGTLAGDNLQAEIIVLTGNNSFFKKRTPYQLGLQEPNNKNLSKPAYFYFRGFDNNKRKKIRPGSWYEVSPDGKNLMEVPKTSNKKFWPNELLTARVTSLLIAREMLLRRYSTFMFEDLLEPDTMAELYGYRLWGRIDDLYKEDLYRRLKFLEEYTRRVETNNFLSREKYLKAMGKKVEFDDRFFKRALIHYYQQKERGIYEAEKIYLNSGQ
jgi:hypothetical protein